MARMTPHITLRNLKRRGWKNLDGSSDLLFDQVARCVCGILAVILLSSVVVAGEILYDDFHDGDVANDVPTTRDGIPVRWTATELLGIRDASSGDFVFTALPESEDFVSADFTDLVLGDTSIRGQVRLTTLNGTIGFAVRNQDQVDRYNYFGIIGYRPDYGGTILFLGRNVNNSYVPLANLVPLPFDIRNEDAMLQLDVLGNELKLWAWKVGDPMPQTPQLVARDATYASGFVRLSVGSGLNKDNTGTFRFVQVSDTHIADPLTGDFDADGLLTVTDIDKLSAEVRAGTHPPRYNLNDDTFVNEQDRYIWVKELKTTYFGDASLDGEFDTGDLVQVLGRGKYETREYASWSEGDWNGDGVFGTGDLVIALQDGGYERGPRAEIAAVPEPSSFLLTWIAMPLLFAFQRGASARC